MEEKTLQEYAKEVDDNFDLLTKKILQDIEKTEKKLEELRNFEKIWTTEIEKYFKIERIDIHEIKTKNVNF